MGNIFSIIFFMVLAYNRIKKMSYQDRYLYQTRQSQKEEEQEEPQREQQGKSSGNLHENEIYSTATIWLSGGNRPTLYLPIDLAKKYKIDKPCRITFYDDNNNNGILIKFLHKKNKNKNNNNNKPHNEKATQAY
jgi:hypothetical protein